MAGSPRLKPSRTDVECEPLSTPSLSTYPSASQRHRGQVEVAAEIGWLIDLGLQQMLWIRWC